MQILGHFPYTNVLFTHLLFIVRTLFIHILLRARDTKRPTKFQTNEEKKFECGRNENKKNRLPFVQQVVFQSLFHLEDEVPKVVHRHDSDVHLSVVPYLQYNNNNRNDK